ncbi:MAG: flagellar basal-body rod protein FlgG [Thermoguttaceae bacterium]
MSVQTLYSAATGMSAMETKLDVIANNLANIETTAFKRARPNFEDLFYRNYMLPGAQDSDGNYTATGIAVGLGSRVSSVQAELKQGAFKQTNRNLDVAIEGQGFFTVNDPSTGEIVYSRAGNFSVNADGALVLGSASTGRIVQPEINIPEDTLDIVISAQGEVSVRQPGSQQLTNVGQMELATFVNPEGLLRLGENLFAETDASGPASVGPPGENGLGVLRQGSLEASNVEPVAELIDLITTQRAFEMNSQAVQVGDEMMQLVANLRRM